MKYSIILIAALFFFECSILRNDGSSLPEHSELPTPDMDTVVIKIEKTDTLPFISVEKWVNRAFVLLEKPPLFQRHGYEIYLCSDPPTECSTPLNPTYELNNRRIRYDTFVGDTLVVTDVQPDSSEWRVTFRDTKFSITLHARTHKGALKDLLLVRDLVAAKERWIGKTVYSRSGIISLEGERGIFSSMKVSRLDSLKVYDVRSGFTPLPVDPIWLMVQVPGNINGFIPIRISWTNTMSDQISDGVAWEDKILEQNPAKLYHWDVTMWELIDNHRIVIDMSKEQVFLSWGKPSVKTSKMYNGTMVECWTYNVQELYFSENRLIMINDITAN